MLIDTGADVTLIPRQVIERLHLEITSARHYELVGFDGSTSLAQVVHVDLVFLGRTFRGQFLLIEGEWGILGRNVLNAVKLLLDGPNFIWSEPK
jgi:predicted aspartyl protease